jgi:hypothetical protein
MLDQDFCAYLEYELTRAFSHSTDNSIKHFWCDGILLPNSEREISQKHINDTKRVATTAFIGKNGQEEYKTTLMFGPKALSKYARGLHLKDCIPDPTNKNWYDVDISNKTLMIKLL